jgi:hypothetical protein
VEEGGSGFILRQYLSIRPEGLRKTTNNLIQDSRCPGRDLNPGPSEYEAGILTTRPRHSVHCGQNQRSSPRPLKGNFRAQLVLYSDYKLMSDREGVRGLWL